LLHAALTGEQQYFAREDAIEETWRIVQPLLDTPPPVEPYERGSWGPSQADSLLTGDHRWQRPWLDD
jgi:glucose-6-phosphate 1-dehydrogenase